MSEERKAVLVTGASGMIGSDLCPRLEERFDVYSGDLRPLAEAKRAVKMDIRDPESCRAACRGMDAVVHLAGSTWEYDPKEYAIPLNVEAHYTLMEAAREEGARQFVFASSNHTVGYHYMEGGLELTEDVELRPDTFYGVTKVYGEALGRYYADKHGMSVTCLRIGIFLSPARIEAGFERMREGMMLSGRDFADLVGRCLDHEEIRFEVFNAVSRCRRPFLSLEKARRVLGYEPKDSPETIFGKAAEKSPPDDFSHLRQMRPEGKVPGAWDG